MQDDEIERQINELVLREAPAKVAKVEPGTRLAEDLEMTSLELVGLMTLIEDRFDILIDDDEAATYVTVADLVRGVRARLA